MSENPGQGSWIPPQVRTDRADAPATRVVPRMDLRGVEDCAIVAGFVAALHAGATGPEPAACLPVVAHMMRAGISAEEIADRYVPAVAHLLGEDWCADRVGFATVTIGTSRLQSLLRELGPEWRADRNAEADAPAILVLVASEVHHTLGAILLSGQLRRQGFSVKLVLGAGTAALADEIGHNAYRAVMVSASLGDNLETLRLLIDKVRTLLPRKVPVVVGGNILAAGLDLCALTGADHATNEPAEALRHCGLAASQRTVVPFARRD